jgi:hypothetical protein
MSYQGSEWTRKIRGAERGVKSVLNALGVHQDNRSNVATVSIPQLALDTGLSPRQVKRNLQRLQAPWPGYPIGIVKRLGGGNGRGDVARYAFIGFGVGKGDISGIERVTLATEKGDIPARKEDVGDAHINRVRAREELQKKELQENQNHHASGALNDWLSIKEKLKTKLPSEEWDLWVRPARLLKIVSGSCLLIAVPPNRRIMQAAKARAKLLNELARSLGAGYHELGITKYPDDYQLERAAEMYPEQWGEAAQRILKKRAQRAVA